MTGRGSEPFSTVTLTTTAVPDEVTSAGIYIDRIARDDADRLLLRDIILDERPTVTAALEAAGAKDNRGHGTARTYRWHLANGQEPCQPCKDAAAALKRQLAAARAQREAEAAKVRASKCGTLRGYRIHLERREVPCQPCCDANAATSRRYRPGPTKKAPADTACGTKGGYYRHGRRNEKPCDACREAHAKNGREYRAKKKREKAHAA